MQQTRHSVTASAVARGRILAPRRGDRNLVPIAEVLRLATETVRVGRDGLVSVFRSLLIGRDRRRVDRRPKACFEIAAYLVPLEATCILQICQKFRWTKVGTDSVCGAGWKLADRVGVPNRIPRKGARSEQINVSLHLAVVRVQCQASGASSGTRLLRLRWTESLTGFPKANGSSLSAYP